MGFSCSCIHIHCFSPVYMERTIDFIEGIFGDVLLKERVLYNVPPTSQGRELSVSTIWVRQKTE